LTLAGRQRGNGALLAGGVLVVAAVVALVMGMGLVGFGLRSRAAQAPPQTVAPAISTTAPPTTAVARRLVAPEPDAIAEIHATAEMLEPVPVLAGLEPADLVHVRVRGFPGLAPGALGLCDGGVCREAVPILTDGDGNTDVAYRLGSDCGSSSCALVVDIGGVGGIAPIVFGAAPPAPVAVIGVERAGSRVEVVVLGARPGASLTALACADDAIRRSTCRPLQDGAVVADAGGRATFTAAAPRAPAQVVVADAGTGEAIAWPVAVPQAEVVVLRPQYPRARVVTALVVALLLVMIAAWLIRSTDWGPPAEATP
jgi:hypothetical protein